MREHVVLEVARGVAERVGFGQLRHRLGALGDETRPGGGERRLNVPVRQRVARILLETRRGRLVGHASPSPMSSGQVYRW